MKNFFSTSLKALGQTGTICPSSKYLIEEITQNINFDQTLSLVEFGTGEGCITEVLLRKMSDASMLHSFELNDDFFEFSSKRFQNDKRLKLLKMSALDFEGVEGLATPNSIDYFISSLPLTLFDEHEVEMLLEKVKKMLKPGGKFIQYQYSLGKWFYFKGIFATVQLGFTLINLPPAIVYTCS